MSNEFEFKRAGLLASICLTLLLSGCGSLNSWPFGGSNATERSGRPANATEYACKGGKKFYVRMLENGAAVWLIYPGREVRLDKVAAAATAGTRYSNGIAILDINGNQAALEDGPSTSLTECKAVVNPG